MLYLHNNGSQVCASQNYSNFIIEIETSGVDRKAFKTFPFLLSYCFVDYIYGRIVIYTYTYGAYPYTYILSLLWIYLQNDIRLWILVHSSEEKTS